MADDLTPAPKEDLVIALAYALTRKGRKRATDSPDVMANVVAERLLEHLEHCGFVVMQKPPAPGGAALARGYSSASSSSPTSSTGKA